MIRSMTGFGRGEIQSPEHKFTVEIRSVNHRYLDLNIKMPRSLNALESDIRNILKEYVQRGKVDVFITREDYLKTGTTVQYNEEIARQYMDRFARIAEQFGLENDIRVSTLARFPDVLVPESGSEDAEAMWGSLAEALSTACASLVCARSAEGEQLQKDILAKLEGMRSQVCLVEERYPQVMEEYTARIREKLQELLEDRQIDEARIATELVIFSDKICTDEETVRLKSHIDSMASVLKKGGFVGRKLDFIAQEMNREANTILSKANDLETSNLAIGLKTEIEKIREQIQNIE